jgi:hypothetical protein
MRRVTVLATAALLLVSSGRPVAAQADTTRHAWPFRAPTFVFQPGLLTSNFVDQPDGTSASTKFNFRVVTAIPTTLPRTTVVAIVQWTPWNKTAGFNSNAPSFAYGPVFSLVNVPLVSLDFDVLGSYGPAARATDESAYTHKLVLEADLSLKVGTWLTHDQRSRWHSLALYVYPAYVATGLPSGSSRWQLLYGASLPIAP